MREEIVREPGGSAYAGIHMITPTKLEFQQPLKGPTPEYEYPYNGCVYDKIILRSSNRSNRNCPRGRRHSILKEKLAVVACVISIFEVKVLLAKFIYLVAFIFWVASRTTRATHRLWQVQVRSTSISRGILDRRRQAKNKGLIRT